MSDSYRPRSRGRGGGRDNNYSHNSRFDGRLGNNDRGHHSNSRPRNYEHEERNYDNRSYNNRSNYNDNRSNYRGNDNYRGNSRGRSSDYNSHHRGHSGDRSRGRVFRGGSRGSGDRGSRGSGRGGFFGSNHHRPQPMEEDEMLGFLAKRYKQDSQIMDLSDVWNDDFWRGKIRKLKLTDREDCERLAECIGKNLPSLEIIDLSNNRLRYLKSYETLAQKLPNLKHLNLSKNNIEQAYELGMVFGKLNLEGIMVEDNPFSRRETIPALASKLKAQGRFPKLTLINGQQIPEGISIGDANILSNIEPTHSIPERKIVGIDEDGLEEPIKAFLQQYVEEFDKGQGARGQALMPFYDDRAAFSLMVQPVKRHDQKDSNNISHLFNISRKLNQTKKNDVDIKHGKLPVASLLDQLPNSKHINESLSFDVAFRSDALLHMSFNGELFEQGQGNIFYRRYFSRALTLVPNDNSNQHGLVIINDLFVLKAQVKTPDNPGLRPPVVPPQVQQPTQTQPQPNQQLTEDKKASMTLEFQRNSGLKIDYTVQILQANNWDFNAAGKQFLELKQNGQIPQEYFS